MPTIRRLLEQRVSNDSKEYNRGGVGGGGGGLC